MGLSLADFSRFFAKDDELPDTWAGIGLHADGVSAVIVQRIEEPVVLNWGYEKLTDGEMLTEALERLGRKLGLHDVACVTWLDEHDYQIKLANMPEVDEAELVQALTWQANEIFPDIGENPVIEAIMFPGPGTDNSEKSEQVYVTGAEHDAVQLRCDLLLDANIKLKCIDIAELCQRNIAELASRGPRGVATVSFTDTSCLLTITRDDILYMTRRLAVGLNDLQLVNERAPKLEQVMIEIQRSLDYYSSHLRQAPVEKILLAPLLNPMPELAEAVRTHLYLEPVYIDVSSLMTWASDMPQRLQAVFFYTIGAALRLEMMDFAQDEATAEDIFG